VSKCQSALIYNTKAGVELASMGIPIIVAGEAWIRNKGFAADVSDADSYFKLIDKLPLKPMSELDIQRARKYAYHFFFRRMIPLDFMEPDKKFYFSAKINSIKHLEPGQSDGLDVICSGILDGTDFIYPYGG
jgi:hypothetical protein